MTEQSARNESRIVKLEIEMKNLMDTQTRLTNEVNGIGGKLDKVIWFLIAILAATNPLTSGLVQKQLRASLLDSSPPAHASEHVK